MAPHDGSPATLDVVVPMYNEALCAAELLERFGAVRDRLRDASDPVDLRLILVDDGSADATVSIVKEIAAPLGFVHPIELSRNFGHQAAVTAGLDASSGDYVCVIDADLQDPPELIGPMLERLRDGELDVVYGRRIAREGESWFKKATASVFYSVIRKLSGLEIPQDTGDFRVMTARVASGLRELPEHNRFLRALVPWMGARSEPFDYERDSRFAGDTKYPFSKMFVLAMHAVFAYSLFPIRLVQALAIAMLGLVAAALPVVGGLWAAGVITPGAPLVIAGALVFQTGLILLGIGMVGGYVHRIQDEVKGRPIYVRRDAAPGDRYAPARLLTPAIEQNEANEEVRDVETIRRPAERG